MAALLSEFVAKVFSTWTVLRLAEQHGTGGRDTSAKIQNLTPYVLQRINIHTIEEDLAEILEDYLNDKLSILCEDDSQYDVARLITSAYALSVAGKTGELTEMSNKLPNGCDLTACATQVVDCDVNEAGESFEDDEEGSVDEQSADDVEMDDC